LLEFIYHNMIFLSYCFYLRSHVPRSADLRRRMRYQRHVHVRVDPPLPTCSQGLAKVIVKPKCNRRGNLWCAVQSGSASAPSPSPSTALPAAAMRAAVVIEPAAAATGCTPDGVTSCGKGDRGDGQRHGAAALSVGWTARHAPSRSPSRPVVQRQQHVALALRGVSVQLFVL
jgi:hypothetical protein